MHTDAPPKITSFRIDFANFAHSPFGHFGVLTFLRFFALFCAFCVRRFYPTFLSDGRSRRFIHASRFLPLRFSAFAHYRHYALWVCGFIGVIALWSYEFCGFMVVNAAADRRSAAAFSLFDVILHSRHIKGMRRRALPLHGLHTRTRLVFL